MEKLWASRVNLCLVVTFYGLVADRYTPSTRDTWGNARGVLMPVGCRNKATTSSAQ